MKVIKILTIILLIVLISLVGFCGVFTQVQNRMEDQVKDYSLAIDLNGARVLRLQANTDSEEVIKDADGNEVELEEELTDEQLQERGYTKETVFNNSEDVMNIDNYNKAKSIIEKRIEKYNDSGINVYDFCDYEIAVEESTGDILVKLPENTYTDDVIEEITTTGKFELLDKDTKEVLLNNDDIKEARVMYNNSTGSGTTVYLEIDFTKEGTKKLEELSSTTYATKSTDDTEAESDENTTNSTESAENTTSENTENTTSEDTENTESTEEEQKEVVMQIDGTDIMTTSFDEPIRTGIMTLSVGTATTDIETLNSNVQNASRIANVLTTGNLPIQYDLNDNKYVQSDITIDMIKYAVIAVLAIVILGIIVWLFRFKLNGLLAGFSYIGLIAGLLLIIRYTNVMISLQGLLGIAVILVLNYVFINKFLSKINKNKDKNNKNRITKEMVTIAEKETYKDFFIKIIPICIVTVTFALVQWIPISSFGMIMFWGLVLIAVYNYFITGSLLKIKVEKKK